MSHDIIGCVSILVYSSFSICKQHRNKQGLMIIRLEKIILHAMNPVLYNSPNTIVNKKITSLTYTTMISELLDTKLILNGAL